MPKGSFAVSIVAAKTGQYIRDSDTAGATHVHDAVMTI